MRKEITAPNGMKCVFISKKEADEKWYKYNVVTAAPSHETYCQINFKDGSAVSGQTMLKEYVDKRIADAEKAGWQIN